MNGSSVDHYFTSHRKVYERVEIFTEGQTPIFNDALSGWNRLLTYYEVQDIYHRIRDN